VYQRSGSLDQQAHLDFFVDDVGEAETSLHQLGATTPDHRPFPDKGRVMRDPARHLFCNGARPSAST
jgi:hypothetical protein